MNCFNGMLLIVTIPLWAAIGVIYSPYYIYKGTPQFSSI